MCARHRSCPNLGARLGYILFQVIFPTCGRHPERRFLTFAIVMVSFTFASLFPIESFALHGEIGACAPTRPRPWRVSLPDHLAVYWPDQPLASRRSGSGGRFGRRSLRRSHPPKSRYSMAFLKLITISHSVKTRSVKISTSGASWGAVSFLGPSGCGKTTTLAHGSGFEARQPAKLLFNARMSPTCLPTSVNSAWSFPGYALFPKHDGRWDIGLV